MKRNLKSHLTSAKHTHEYRLKFIVTAGAAMLITLILAVTILQQPVFKLVSTTPANGSQPSQYTPVAFTFNQPLDASSVETAQITLDPNIGGKVTIANKSIIFTPSAPYAAHTSYRATLTDVLSKNGDRLGNISVTFTPKYVPFSMLPTAVQKSLTLDKRDELPPYVASSIAMSGTAPILDNGAYYDHLISLRAAFYLYFAGQNREVRALELSKVTGVLQEPGSDGGLITFDVSVSGEPLYHAEMTYHGASTVRLKLLDATTNQTAFESGDVSQL